MMKARAAPEKPRKSQAAKPVSKVAGGKEALAYRPAIVLVEPQLGENIGFAARAMANFGLNDLRLVAPRDGWPNDKAFATAAIAEQLVSEAKIYARTEDALGDLHFVLATTARPRGMTKQVLNPESAARELAARAARGERCGILFGAEKSGLDNGTIALADAILTAPVDSRFASLSLPQAVLLVAYEWLKTQNSDRSLGRATGLSGAGGPGFPAARARPATRAELFHLFGHLEQALDAAGFLRPEEKKPAMVRNIRNMFHRMRLTDQDVRTWRGMIAALAGAKRKRAGEGGS